MAVYPKLLNALNINNTDPVKAYNGTGGASVPLRSAIVKNILLTNNGGVSVVLNVYVSPANSGDAVTTKFRVAPKDLSIPAGGLFSLDDELTLSRQYFTVGSEQQVHGDIVMIQLTTAGANVDVVINGIESDM